MRGVTSSSVHPERQIAQRLRCLLQIRGVQLLVRLRTLVLLVFICRWERFQISAVYCGQIIIICLPDKSNNKFCFLMVRCIFREISDYWRQSRTLALKAPHEASLNAMPPDLKFSFIFKLNKNLKNIAN